MSQPAHLVLLGVNIDHVATLRQAGGTRYPDPVQAAFLAEQAGADSITLHPRDDRRHIQERDMSVLKETLATRMNLEMAITDEWVSIAERIRPEDCCLVPERREELSTKGGLDVAGQTERIAEVCRRLGAAGVRVSLFIDADLDQVDAAMQVGAPAIELHTGHYAGAVSGAARARELKKIATAAEHAHRADLKVNAGHGLNYHNVEPVCRIPEIAELNIGHAIIARGLFTGLEAAVREMKRSMRVGRFAPQGPA
jgi:pyridoxine 5-phosphate synthase